MEKIQAAIAKARATRAEQGSSATAETTATSAAVVDHAAVAETVVAQPEPAVVTNTRAQDIAANWAALPSFKPSKSLMNKGHVATFEGGVDAVHFDALRTKLLKQMRQNNWKRVAITSASVSCGKSTIALNLAFSMARQPALRVILADTDFRRPSLGAMCNLQAPQSFAKVLQGEALFSQSAHRYGDNMAVSTNTGTVSRAAEVLSGEYVAEALRQIDEQYAPDITIFDMPPMMLTDDMMAFSSHVDCVMLVAASEESTIKDIDAAERELSSHTNVVGVVLNKCRYMEPSLDYGY
jgi:Mrp family chromosome partitioning ATPase